ncbi:MAG: ornithine cyclodeaminase family protein [Bryobacterales bacterium]|nr:ornithine cyclodeaminase family protein [Bryobacterales bacterium]MDE0622258.1 ornithine cyclodeaminase family protein [Bryobacterales bacterium]
MIRVTEKQVRETISMPEAMDLVERMLLRLAAGRAVNHPRRRVAMDSRTLLHYMAGGDNENGLVGIKVYASNPAVGAPDFRVLLFDSNTAQLLAEIEANILGQIRTGAASGVATRHLARPDASRVAIFGSGFQAETQLEAVSCARKLEQARVFSRKAERRHAFAERMSDRLSLSVTATQSPEEALDGADIVITVTNSRSPVFPGRLLRPGTHINAAGSNHVLRREIDGDAVRMASLIAVDSMEQAQMEAGDLTQAEKDGVFDWADACELHDVLAGNRPGRTSAEQITLFESQGLAVEDIAMADFLYRKLR